MKVKMKMVQCASKEQLLMCDDEHKSHARFSSAKQQDSSTEIRLQCGENDTAALAMVKCFRETIASSQSCIGYVDGNAN